MVGSNRVSLAMKNIFFSPKGCWLKIVFVEVIKADCTIFDQYVGYP